MHSVRNCNVNSQGLKKILNRLKEKKKVLTCSVNAKAKQTIILECEEHRSLTTLLSHCNHGVVADQAGNEGQCTGP